MISERREVDERHLGELLATNPVFALIARHEINLVYPLGRFSISNRRNRWWDEFSTTTYFLLVY